MNRRDAETRREDRITDCIIGSAIEVHKTLGPGLLESAYEECLCYELTLRDLSVARQVELPVQYKGIKGNDLEQFRGLDTQIILTPDQHKTGEAVLPFEKAQQQ